MSTLLESYRILGVSVGADMATVTTSYKQLCREYHPDISDRPDAEELMKQVNLAYTILREKFKREAAFRDRANAVRSASARPAAARPVRRHAAERPKPEQTKTREATADPQRQAAEQYQRAASKQAAVSATAEMDSRKVLHSYFDALNTFDYKKAYEYLSEHDKANISLESFIRWRESVAKLYPMREFKIDARSSEAVVTWGGSRIFHARKFKVIVKEDDYHARRERSGEHDKLVIIENAGWRVFLGYKEVGELTQAFEQRFERKKKRDVEERWDEYVAGINMEYDMFTMEGFRKAASKEMYRQRRYGSPITFAAISVKLSEEKSAGMGELLRSTAKTINGHLREIDICAYAGDGVFAVLFVELGKRNAKNVVARLVDSIRKNADPGLGDNAQIESSFDAWSENRYVDRDEINKVLGKFGKMM